jgi:membrane-bound inhibitor of C-type lysozyme
MKRRAAGPVFKVALVAAGAAAGAASASAQSFQSYHCADGTRFIAAFYDHDSRAHLQIDGQAATLSKRLNWSGSRYQGDGVTLMVTKAGVTVRHARRPVTACEADTRPK